MNVKLLANGSSLRDFVTRKWGLSLLIDNTILFDCFCNYSLLKKKMKAYKVDTSAIKSIVISHEHWDHIDGLWGFLKEHQNIDVYLPAETNLDIKERVNELGGKLKTSFNIEEIKTDIHVTEDLIGIYKKKPIAEQSMALNTARGIILLVGCAHPGIGALIQQTKETFDKPIYGIIGGLHLFNKTKEEILHEALQVKTAGITLVAPLHCSGKKAQTIFKTVFQENCINLKEGEELMLA